LSIQFTPTINGAESGTLTINSNVGSAVASLTGTGTSAVLFLNPTSANFGNIAVGSTSATTTFTLQNTGTQTLTGLFQNQVLSDLTNYSIVANGCGSSLTASASCTLGVQFHPTLQGSLPATLTFITNASNSPTVATLSGTGTISGNVCAVGTVCGITIKGNVEVLNGVTVK